MVDPGSDELSWRRSPLLVTVAMGLALGLFALTTDAWPGAPRDVRIIGQLAGPWLLVAGLAGRRGQGLRDAARHGLIALSIGVVTYDLPLIAMGAPPLFAAFWLVVAVIVGPVGGMLGQLAADSTVRGALGHVALWGVAVGEVAARIDPLNNNLAWVAAALLIIAVVTAPARRVLVTLGVCLVGVGSALVFPLLLSGIAGW